MVEAVSRALTTLGDLLWVLIAVAALAYISWPKDCPECGVSSWRKPQHKPDCPLNY